MSGYFAEILLFAYYIIVHPQAKKHFPVFVPVMGYSKCVNEIVSWGL
jgi:hypothetical protein